MRMGDRIILILFTALWALVPSEVRSGGEEPVPAGHADSIRVSAVYMSHIDLRRNSVHFPWNDPLEQSHYRDRASVSVLALPHEDIDFFIKGASGYRGTEYREGGTVSYVNRFILEQGHLNLRSELLRSSVKLFSRERVFRTGNRLILPVSSDGWFISRGGEGIAAAVKPGAGLEIYWTGAIIRDYGDVIDSSGLPDLSGTGDHIHLIESRMERGRWHGGVTALSRRSIRYGDAVAAGFDLGVSLGGADILVEYARSSSGGWSDFSDERLFGIDLDGDGAGGISGIFSGNSIFSTEILGLERHFPRAGRFGVIPSYSFLGRDFVTGSGEIRRGLIESRLTSWWKHPSLSLSCDVDLIDGYSSDVGESFTVMSGIFRTGFRGGLRLEKGIILRKDDPSSLLFSLTDDNEWGRIGITARIDEPGGDYCLSYIIRGSINLSSSWSVRNVLYLEETMNSFYRLQLDFRPHRRFLLSAAVGSFRPRFEEIRLFPGDLYDLSSDFVRKGLIEDRYISFFTRIWFGEI